MKKISSLITLFIFVFLLIASPFNNRERTTYAATTIYVNSSTGNDSTGDGSSEAPYKTFHKAYTEAVDGDTLNLTGTFDWSDTDETGDATTNGYTIAKNLTIQGQAADETIIQAASSAQTAGKRVFTISSGYTATIEDLHIRYGHISSSSSSGGGIYNQGTVIINRCNITDNWLNGYGGALSNAGTATVNDSNLSNNYAYSQGGGIQNAYTSGDTNILYVTNTTIANNSTQATVATVGGAGLYIRSGTAYVTNATIAYNNAPDGTGDTTGIDISSGNVYVKNSIVAYNKVSGSNVINGNGWDVGTDSSSYFHDNGGNIFGRAMSTISFDNTTWVDATSGSGDSVYTLQGDSSTGSLYLDSELSENDGLYGTDTIGPTSSSSILIDNGLATANESVSIPSTDQRSFTRTASIDIGALEYNASYTPVEPTTQASEVTFSDIQYDQITVSWTNGDGARRIAFMKQDSSGTATPVDTTTYAADSEFGSGDQIGSTGWYAIYSGGGTSVTVTGLTQSTDYIVQVFEYGGIKEGIENYLTDSATNNPNTEPTYTPQTIYANSSTGNDSTGDGTSGTPYKTFHKAYTEAQNSDTIDLAGTFDWSDTDETGDASTTGYTIAKDITIQGQSASSTIIQAASTEETAGKRVFTISSGYTVSIEDLHIRYGHISSSSSSGGGIYNQGTLTINRCNMTDNWLNGYGGALSNAGTATVTNSNLSDNYAYSQGGGIQNAYTSGNTNTLYVTNTTITNNLTRANVATVGGAGLYVRSGTAYVTNTTIAYNNADNQNYPYNTGNTSGLDISGGNVYIKNSIVAYNKVNGSNVINGDGWDAGTDNTSYFHDNGGNIFGRIYSSISFDNTTWTDAKSSDGDSVFTLEGDSSTGSLYIDTNVGTNDATTGVKTLAVTNASSIAIGNALDTANETVSIPTTDARGYTRTASKDIGSFEYDASYSVSEPTTQASEVSYSSIDFTQMDISWTAGNGSKSIVFVKETNTGTTTPVDATTYTANAAFGSGTQIGETGWYCVYNGTGTSVTVTGLTTGTDYIAQVFTYNGILSGYEDYLTDTASNNPATQATAEVVEPTTQASEVTFSSPDYTQITASWTNGNGTSRIAFMKAANTGTATPVDDTSYTASTTFGSGTQIGSTGWYAIYNGTGTSVTVTGLTAGTDYIVQVFEYDSYLTTYDYLTDTGTNNPNTSTTTAVTTPSTQATSISFSNVGYTTADISWSNGDGDGRAVFVKAADSGTAAPVDDTSYTANAAFGSGDQIGSTGWYCVYAGTGTSVSVTGLTSGTEYIAHVVEYGHSGSEYKYLTTSDTNNPNTQTTNTVNSPTTQASEISISSVAGNQFTASWSNGDGENRVVFVKAASSGEAAPSNNTTYTANTAFGSGTQIGTTGWYTVYNGTGTSVTITGLSTSTTYRVQVMEYNGDAGEEYYFTDTATNNPKNQATAAEIQIGDGTSYQNYLPWANYYRYSYSQMIYTSEDLGSDGAIDYIKFQYNGYSTYTWDPIVVYMGHTTKSSFSSGSDWVPIGDLTQVYSGSVAVTSGSAGWYTITLDDEFEYNGTDNLVIAIDNNHGSYTSSSSKWYYTSASNTYLYRQSDSTNYLPSSPGTGTLTSYRPNIVMNLSASTATLTYTAGANGSLTGETSQEIEKGSDGSPVTAVPDEGYQFVNWSDGSIENPRTDTSVTGDVTVTANFATQVYSLNYSAGVNGYLTGQSPQNASHGGSGLAVTAVPNSGYRFNSWSDGSTDNPRTDTNVTENISVTASFEEASTIYVDSSTGDDNIGDGSIDNPYKTFDKAYGEITAGGIIDLTGTFDWTDENEDGDAQYTGYTIEKDITIRGNGADTTIIQAASADNTADRRVFTIAADTTVTIKDLAMRYGKINNGTGYATSNEGGGILNLGTVTINDCEIYNNRVPTGYGGGGLSNRYLMTINDSAIYNNVAQYMGGGVLNSYTVDSNGYLTITNSTIYSNEVTQVIAYTEGGGVHFRKGSGTITNTTVTDNTACGVGGVGMDDPNGTVKLMNNIFAGNHQKVHSYCSNGYYPKGFDFRQSGYGNVVDNGYNIIGGYSQHYHFTDSTDWTDTDRNGIFTKYGSSTTGSLNLDTSAALNSSPNKTTTWALITDSIAINNGSTGTNGEVNVPNIDQRGAARNGSTDIGAYEYSGSFLDTYTLTYLAGIGGSISGDALQENVPEGANGTAVTATSVTGYEFVDWSDESTDNPRTDTSVTDNISVTANFQGITYDLTYTAGTNGSLTGTTSQTIDYGEDGTAVTAVPDGGYNFTNWSDGSVENPRTDTSVTADVDVTANFAENAYRLIYTAGANGSISGSSSQLITSGADGTAVTAVPNTGYSFVNWSDESTDNPRTDTSVSSNLSVTANFTVNSYAFSYTAGANGTLTGTTSQTVDHGSDGTAITAVPATGYAFVNWSDGSTNNPRTDTSASEDITVTANFAINAYTLTYTADTRGALTGTTSQAVSYAESGTAVTAVPSTGHSFFRWSDGSTDNPRTDANVTASKSVRAYFIRNAYTSTYTAGANGSLVGDTTQITYYGGTNRPVAAVPDAGYSFLGWSDESTDNPRTDTNISSNISVTANFGLKSYTLEYSAGDNGSVTGSTTQTISHGETGTAVTAIPETGYSFIKWSDGSITNPRTDSNANVNVSAIFGVNRYALTYTTGSNGTLTGVVFQTVSSGGGGTAVTAVPNTGYSFVNWSDESTDNPRTDTGVNASIYVTANFEKNSYTLSYAAGSNGSLSGDVSQSVDYGENGTAVTASGDSGYHFLRWSDNSADNPRTDFVVTEDISVTAVFEEDRPTTTVYVNSSTGNDSTGDGSSGSPYKTFYKGYTMSSPGDILDLTGTFTWTDTAEVGDRPVSGYVIGKNLTIQGQGADATIIQSAALDNVADRRVFTISPGVTATIQNLTVRYGRVSGYGNDGGGVRNDGIATITDCEIYNNRSAGDSGGGISNRHTLTITNSSIYNNVAYYMGGGIVNSYYVDPSGYLTITNSTIAYNQQTTGIAYTEGGGIHFRKGSGTITNSTISYNTATGIGGVGMDDPSGTLTIKNTIIANNIRRNSDYYVDFGFRQSGTGNVVDNGYNIIGVSNNYTWSGTGDWTDVNRDGTFALYGSTNTGSLGMETSLAYNGNTNKTKTLSISSSSIAVDVGNTSDNGSVSVPTSDQRDYLREETPDIGAFEYVSPPSDTTPPVISNVSATPSSTTAEITWTTSEAASSQVKYDPNQIRTTATDITNEDTGVTSHEVTLTELIACAKYYYVVSSSDSSGNTSTSDEGYFFTSGCAGNASVDDISETTAVPEYGGTVNQTASDLSISLTIPDGFAEDPADFQLKGLGSETVINALSEPTNYNSVGDSLFDVKALDTPTTTIDEFDSEVEVAISYTEDDISGMNEATLKIHRNDDGEWTVLNDCTVDTSANTVTCTTNNFSVFGLFGELIGYDVTYIAGANGSITGDTAQEVPVGGDGTAVTAVPNTGYSFVNWSDGSTENPRTDTGVNADIYVTAYFSETSEGGALITPAETTVNESLVKEFGHTFVDIVTHWGQEYIKVLYKKKIISGYDEYHFFPDKFITRAEFTKMVVGFMEYKLLEDLTETSFTDLALTDWYTLYIETAKKQKILDGYDDKTFRPNEKIKRGEAIKIVVLAKYQGVLPEFEDIFTDVFSTDWFAPYIVYAFRNNIVNGYDGNLFKPGGEMTRAEAAKIISLIK